MLSLHTKLEESANTVSKIDDRIRELILGIKQGDYDTDEIVKELDDIKAMLY